MQGVPLVTVNKIFRAEDIEEILAKVQSNYDELKRAAEAERAENEKYKYEYQERSLGSFNGYLKYNLEFADGSKVEYDNFAAVKNVLVSRLRTIKRIYVYYSVSFAIKAAESTETRSVSEHMSLWIGDDELKIETALDGQGSRLKEVHDMMVAKVKAAPEKYDRLIRNKELISWKIGVADGLVALAVVLMGLTVGVIAMAGWRKVLLGMFWVVPVAVVGLSLVLGILFGSVRTARIYNKLIPNKKYAGYDTNTHQSVYNDDIEKFKGTSEVLIGEKVDNGKLREELKGMELRSRKRMWMEMGVIGGLIVVLLVICLVGRG